MRSRSSSIAYAICAVVLALGTAMPNGNAVEGTVGRMDAAPEDEVTPRAAERVIPRGALQRAALQEDARISPIAPPAIAVPGAEVWVEVRVTNTGNETWYAAGPAAVRLSYHWYDGAGGVVVWDGARTPLTSDVPPGRSALLVAAVRAPAAEGYYRLVWDMVRDGATGWFTEAVSVARGDLVAVEDGAVTLWGKGWGHGSGLSQWGAQGWAQGVAGVKMNGEQIALHYFPGASLGKQPPSSPFRVLLSAPSTGCVGRTIYDSARMWSAGGMRVVNDMTPSVVYGEVAPNEAVTFREVDGILYVRDEAAGRWLYVGENDAVTLVPIQWWDPISIQPKGLSYRGNIRVQVGGAGISVVNYVSSDDYMQGVLPSEMPADWELEALRAQAITARTYAAWRQSTAQKRTWDVLDDIADQCYGGWSHESPRSTAAVQATKGAILVYKGAPIRALFSSAHGGETENVGCTLEVERIAGRWECDPAWPYMEPVDDPAELLAYDRRGPMPHELWARSFSFATIRHEIIVDYGIDVGELVTMQFALSSAGRPVSVKVVGSLGVADLAGDKFLRHTLGLKSTFVRPAPF